MLNNIRNKNSIRFIINNISFFNLFYNSKFIDTNLKINYIKKDIYF